jgi:MFS family permease
MAGVALLGLGFTPILSSLLIKGQFLTRLVAFNHLNIIYPIIFISCFLLGLSAALMIVPTMTIISEDTPNEFLGRVWGVANLFQNTLAAIPLLIFGALADRISVLPLIFVFAILAFNLYTTTRSAKVRAFLRDCHVLTGIDDFFPIETNQ